jgi:hypothetical protein
MHEYTLSIFHRTDVLGRTQQTPKKFRSMVMARNRSLFQ